MPKFPYYESAIHHFLLQAKRTAEVERLYHPQSYDAWEKFILSLTFEKINSNTVRVIWAYPKHGEDVFSIDKIAYYVRGDTKEYALEQKKRRLVFHGDNIKTKNDLLFFSFFARSAKKAGFIIHTNNKPHVIYGVRSTKGFADEERLFDNWAQSVDIKTIDVKLMNESPTIPEMKFIMQQLGDIRGQKIVDLGCGLGEAAVYFALKGARVTAVDLSQEMLDVVKRLAKRYHVHIRTVLASVEHLPFERKEKFDIFYAGNLFHHVDIPISMKGILSYMHRDSVLVCWEPVRYNPVINMYRKIATSVRSFGERPLGLSEVQYMKQFFKENKVRWFWLTSLLLFVYMYCIERRNPNKERFWKSVVKEGPRRVWAYIPLAVIDRVLLTVFPFLAPLCWNVVLYLKKPYETT